MISLRKVLLSASLAVLVTGGPQVAVADSMPMMSTPSSAETGHVQWDWWRYTTVSSDFIECEEHASTMAKSPETGPVNWNWFNDIHRHAMADAPAMHRTMNSELGNVPYQWWRYHQKDTPPVLTGQHC